MHFQFDLADDARLVHEFDHFVVFFRIKGRNLHGEDVDAALRAEFHLFQMLVIGGCDDDGLNVWMLRKHLFRREIAGNAVVVKFIDVFCTLICGTGGDPIQLAVFA